MFASTISLASHVLVSSLKLVSPLVHALEYVLPYWTMASNKVNFNTKHLKKGDPLPPYNGKLRVYNMRYCPYAQRAILALNAKEVDYEVVNIDLMDKPEWFFSKSAFGKVPSLEIADGVCIYESLVIVEYIDEVYPRRPLLSKDPVQKAFDKIIIEAMTPVQTLHYRVLKSPETITEETVNAFHKALDFLQEQLIKREILFLGGSEPGFVDYMIWPWFERLILTPEIDERTKIDAEKYKLLLEYFERMFKDPAVSQYLIPKDVLNTFLDYYRKGKPVNYELLLQD